MTDQPITDHEFAETILLWGGCASCGLDRSRHAQPRQKRKPEDNGMKRTEEWMDGIRNMEFRTPEPPQAAAPCDGTDLAFSGPFGCVPDPPCHTEEQHLRMMRGDMAGACATPPQAAARDQALDSPDFRAKELEEFKARGFRRINRAPQAAAGETHFELGEGDRCSCGWTSHTKAWRAHAAHMKRRGHKTIERYPAGEAAAGEPTLRWKEIADRHKWIFRFPQMTGVADAAIQDLARVAYEAGRADGRAEGIEDAAKVADPMWPIVADYIRALPGAKRE